MLDVGGHEWLDMCDHYKKLRYPAHELALYGYTGIILSNLQQRLLNN